MFARALLVTLMAAVSASATADARVLGSRLVERGDHGWDVAILQRVLGWKGYHPGPVDGAFGPRTRRAVRKFQHRRGLVVDERVGPQTIGALASTWKLQTASYYGPGLYGNRMACGGVLRHRTRGVAHRTLPCGERVVVAVNGRIAIWRVVDRGPHRRGVSLDLTEASARALHLTTTAQVRAGW